LASNFTGLNGITIQTDIAQAPLPKPGRVMLSTTPHSNAPLVGDRLTVGQRTLTPPV
jgi:hypothetical protein